LRLLLELVYVPRAGNKRSTSPRHLVGYDTGDMALDREAKGDPA